MITVKLLGGAKKSFSTDTLVINHTNITIEQLLENILEKKSKNAPELDTKNILIAVNGVDSSAMEGKLTNLKDNDVVSIIPIIHGGSPKRNQFKISKLLIELIQVKKTNQSNTTFLDELRKKHRNLIPQAISSHYILSPSHAKKIITISLESKKNHTLLSKKLETDIIMRFAGTTQITQAIEKVGITNEKKFIIIAIGKKSLLDKLHDELKPFLLPTLISVSNQNFLKKQFNISTKQLNSVMSKSPLEDLLAEKAAILS